MRYLKYALALVIIPLLTAGGAVTTVQLTTVQRTTGTTFSPAPVASPMVTGPLAGTPVTTSRVALPPSGYVEQEFFVRGTATRYVQAGNWGSDGRWDVTAAATAPYQTRILVRRPADPARFNGTVVVEWLDAPLGDDGDIEFNYEVRQLLHAGYAWVGVSSAVDPQADAIDALRQRGPTRYDGLTFPGISYSYSIFSQVAQALRHPAGVAPLGDLRPRTLLADGDSGGAHLLLTYYNAIQPIDRLFNGFLLHSRATSSQAISEPGTRTADQTGPQPPDQPSPPIVHVRTDLPTPVLEVQTEFDVVNAVAANLNSYPARQPDSPTVGLWELAGTPHADVAASTEFAPPLPQVTPHCTLPINNGGQQTYAMDTALTALNQWARDRVPAPEFPLLDVTVTAGHPAYIRDRYGNVVGGVRTPDVQAPIATLTGSGNTSPNPPPGGLLADPCMFAGTSTPLADTVLRALYPTHADYVNAVREAAQHDVATGVLQASDAWEIIVAAQEAN